MVKGCLFLLILWGGSFYPLSAGPYRLIEKSSGSQNISLYFDMCHFAPTEKVPENPLQVNKNWKRVKRSGVSLGYSQDTLFFRVSFENPEKEKQTRLFELNFTTLDTVILYMPEPGGGFKRVVSGDMIPFANRDVQDRNPVFLIQVPPGKSTWFVSVRSSGSFQFRFLLYSMNDYLKERDLSLSLLWLIFGWLLLMVIINLIIYLQVKENVYLYYVFFFVTVLLYRVTVRGFSMQYLWPDSPWWNGKSIPLFMGLVLLSLGLFIYSYFDTPRKYPVENRVIFYTAILPGGGIACLSFLLPVSLLIQVVMVLFCLLTVISIWVMIKGAVRKDRSSLFFSVGMLFVFISIPVSVLTALGILNYNGFFVNSIDASFAFFSLFLSLGLGDRINTMKHSLEKTQEKIKFQNDELKAANKELQAANEEFEAQNEELVSVCTDLEESEQKFREISELLPQTVFEVNSIGGITYVNQHAFEQMGYASEDVKQGINALDLVIPEQRERVIKRMTEMIDQDEVNHSEYTIVKKDGTHYPALIFTRPIMKNGKLKGYRGVITDLTEQKKNEAIMVQSEKMMTVGGLAAGMAHEINNPLGIVMQGIQNTRRRFDPDRKMNREPAESIGLDLDVLKCYMEERGIATYLDGIENAGARASEIIRNMLAFSRKSSGNREAIDINDLLNEVLGLAENDYDLKKKYDFRHIAVIRDYDSTLPPVPVIKTEIEQVFLNIIKNSAQALFEYFSGSDGPELSIRTFIEKKMAVVEISDNGPGMNEETRKRIFEPFFSTKDSDGTGLGLSVSYFIVTGNHDGIITVESELDRGTTFHLELPLEGKG